MVWDGNFNILAEKSFLARRFFDVVRDWGRGKCCDGGYGRGYA